MVVCGVQGLVRKRRGLSTATEAAAGSLAAGQTWSPFWVRDAGRLVHESRLAFWKMSLIITRHVGIQAAISQARPN